MRNNDIIKKDNIIYRIIDITDTNAFVIDCSKKTMPKWVDLTSLSSYSLSPEELEILPDINELDMLSRKVAYERFTVISNILPFISDKNKRSTMILQTAIDKGISRQTVCAYLWLYLVYQNISALAPKPKENEKALSETEKNINYALNKYFYNQDKNALSTAYTLMLKEKYCDSSGNLLENYPSFYQFRYFYRKHRKMQNFYISRDGIKNYQRNNRPLLGNGIQDFAHTIGFGMLDSTICDIYLINTSGEIIGRPILTACVDSYSGLCCGYSLSWEGGVYSLRSLMLNVISDKKKWCRKFGIKIDKADWNCDKLPSTLITDMGKEYASSTFEQISDLGVTVINLPPYRPELKGMVEKFFDIIQNLYKPYLKGKGIIEPDFQERGGYDYRKDSCLTMNDFEKIIIRCIIHYNTKIIKENFPYTEKMLSENIKPFSNCIWNYSIKISACINANFFEKDMPYDGGTHWADSYYTYALENGIIKETDFAKTDFDKPITRDRLFYIFANTLPDSEYIEINEKENAPEKNMADYVEKLFCAGIVVGNENGFELENNITRADTTILISRMCAYSRRQFVE